MTTSVVFDPLMTPLQIAVVGATVIAVLVLTARRLPGAWPRALAGAVIVTALANPSIQREEREPFPDIVLLAVDESASQGLSDRRAHTGEAAARVSADLEAMGVEVRTATVGDGPGDAGTELMTALSDLKSDAPQSRVAGAILVTDGLVHDAGREPEIPAPVNVLLSGRRTDWDRRLIIKNAPAFAIIGEDVPLTLRVQDRGAGPGDAEVEVEISVDGGSPRSFMAPVGRDIELQFQPPHGGLNVVRFATPPAEGELTDRNNAAVARINGVRDRLRVLLISGEPHAGQRTWRNLLKSDASVDLVHFTILRPPEKLDGVPITELSLISFPTRELFLEKVDDFDLIIFDRYKRRGILPQVYLDNVKRYIFDGGAVLIAAGPDFASADSLFRSPLGEALPAAPTSLVIEEGFKPLVSEVGGRHPVTAELESLAPANVAEGSEADGPGWGRWLRQVELELTSGHAVMTGAGGRPLLVLDRVGEGRVALLGSDHAWLWSRGYEGGGPQLELLRRLAHWMMKEPELEEDALVLSDEGGRITITRRILEGAPDGVTVTTPDGSTLEPTLEETAPGTYSAVVEVEELGIYRVTDGTLNSVIAIGPAAPREFVETVSTGDVLAPLAEARRGGITRLEDGVPDIRLVSEGRAAAGRGWIGITPRGAYATAEVRIIPLVSGWLFLFLAASFAIWAWLKEGRR